MDEWRRAQPELPSRTEAIRRLVELGLKAKGREAMSDEAETPLEATRRYVIEQEAKIDQQRLLIRQLAAAGVRPSVRSGT